jgi:hypothetical protein
MQKTLRERRGSEMLSEGKNSSECFLEGKM